MNKQETMLKLQAYEAEPQVLIGHQYSTILSVLHGAKESDIHALTGEEAAIVGLDFLSLIGAEGAAPVAAFQENLAATRTALDAGAMITLSCHFPNFEYSSHIQGSDFSRCTYNDAKIVRPCTEDLLRPGIVQERFHAALDLVIRYCLTLQEMGQTILFRPFHEDNGDWFWWGTCISPDDFRKIWIHVHDYMEQNGVHNLLYGYSPNGPIVSKEQYLARYPGDDYVDILGFDYYDDCLSPDSYDFAPFEKGLAASCGVVSRLARERGKIPAISETGVRVKAAGADSLLPSGNPILGADWYERVLNIASNTGMTYLLFWGNYGPDNFFVPYPGHELAGDFLRMYHDEKAVFSREFAEKSFNLYAWDRE